MLKNNKTVGQEVTNILKLARVKLDESALKECGMDWQAPLDQAQEDRYNLTITTKDKTVTVNTSNPEDIIHMMKLGGQEITGHTIEPANDIAYGSGALTGLGLSNVPALGTAGMEGEPAAVEIGFAMDDDEMEPVAGDNDGDGDHDMHDHEIEDSDEEESEEDEDEEDDKVKEEAWGNSPAGTSGAPQALGDITDHSAAGTGEGDDNYGKRKAAGQGDNPMAFEAMKDSYSQFKAQKIAEAKKKKPDDDNDGVPNWADEKPGEDDNADKKSGKKGMSAKQEKFFGKKKAKKETTNEDLAYMRKLAGLK